MGVPEEFSKYLQYCRNIMFEEKPDYNYLRSLFKTMMANNAYNYDGNFDWIIKKEEGTSGEQKIKAMLTKESGGKAPI